MERWVNEAGERRLLNGPLVDCETTLIPIYSPPLTQMITDECCRTASGFCESDSVSCYEEVSYDWVLHDLMVPFFRSTIIRFTFIHYSRPKHTSIQCDFLISMFVGKWSSMVTFSCSFFYVLTFLNFSAYRYTRAMFSLTCYIVIVTTRTTSDTITQDVNYND